MNRIPLVAVLLAAAAAPAASPSIVGRWEPVRRAASGVGTALEFRPDGALLETSIAMIEKTYRFDGRRLVVSSVDPRTGKVADSSADVEIHGDTMTVEERGGPPRRLTRVAAPRGARSPIVGVWAYRHESGAQALETFTPGGVFRLRIPIRTTKGAYSVSGDTVTMRLEGEPERKARFELRGGRLRLTDAGGARDYVPAVRW
jgi:hypothetical protein